MISGATAGSMLRNHTWRSPGKLYGTGDRTGVSCTQEFYSCTISAVPRISSVEGQRVRKGGQNKSKISA